MINQTGRKPYAGDERIMIIYLAGKIKGDDNYKDKFARVESYLMGLGHIVINPTLLPAGLPEKAYMPICMTMMEHADAVYFLEDWIYSPGARLEQEYAIYQKKLIMYEKEM